ncbi:MAG TPA: hypothetical protein VKT76_04395 [Bradyrhizobium sp.]|nr:hypothetical protein [Bradyrhizobium sp.]
MPSYSPRSGIHPALTSFADECGATLARLIAYVGALALFGIVALHVWDQFQSELENEPADKAVFSLALRSRPAFAVSSLDPPEKSEAYEIFRHPEGGRKDIFHWGPPGEKPAAELEIYRLGREFDPSQPLAAEIAARMAPEDPRELETAGIIDSKFGTVALLQFPGGQSGTKSCLGFFKRFEDSMLQISGWSCQGPTLPARRSAIGCMLNHLTLLASGNEPKLAELFAKAELKRGPCTPVIAGSTDWVTSAENPRLRGTL